MNKIQIHEFDPLIYPRKLWVVINKDRHEVVKQFFNDIDNIKIELPNNSHSLGAITFTCYKLDSKDLGVLIIFDNKSVCDIKTIAHESAHAADFIMQRIGEDEPGMECYAYLVGWIADCCERVKLNKE